VLLEFERSHGARRDDRSVLPGPQASVGACPEDARTRHRRRCEASRSRGSGVIRGLTHTAPETCGTHIADQRRGDHGVRHGHGGTFRAGRRIATRVSVPRRHSGHTRAAASGGAAGGVGGTGGDTAETGARFSVSSVRA
jgi:hypothetical protein